MPPPPTAQVLLSPAELSYLYDSLSLSPPIRPDGRTSTQFRPLVAESDILPGANGSARICFADGTEAIVGVKAEVEKSAWRPSAGEHGPHLGTGAEADVEMDDEDDAEARDASRRKGMGENSWVEMSIEIPGFRDDDALPVFLSSMLAEALLANGELKDRLFINMRFHWKLYIDVLLLSQPLSYPLPLLSLTTHLALLSTRLPKLISQSDEDPLFSDDWAAATPLYPSSISRPPVTLLVAIVGKTTLFDPAADELAVAEGVLAVSIAIEGKEGQLKLLSLRTIDPPSRLTPPGIPNALNPATGGTAPNSAQEAVAAREALAKKGVWTPPRGGVGRGLIASIVKEVLKKGGVGEEVLDALESVVGK